MIEGNLPDTGANGGEPKSFEQLKLANPHGAEYWSARDLQALLGYSQWRSDAGYRGLYGGIGSEAIKQRKGIAPAENLLDRMDSTELAANQFRITQTREKLNRENVKGQQRAIHTHEQVGREVRQAIARIGGTMPEKIPPAEPITQVKKRLKNAKPKLELDGPDAKGLSG